MSKVARRKELLATPAISLTAIVPTTGRDTAFVPPSPPLCAPDGRAVRVVHIVAELAPFARSGGLGEAVNSLARFQAASRHSDVDRHAALRRGDGDTRRRSNRSVRRSACRSDRDPKRFGCGGSIAGAGSSTRAVRSVYFIESEEYFARPYIYGPPGSDYPDNGRRYACFTLAALQSLPTIAGSEPVLAARARLAYGARARLSADDASRRTSATVA